MKVFFDYRIFYLQKYGGISRYFINLNKEFKLLNVDSNIYAPISINAQLSKQKKNFKNHLSLKKIYKYTGTLTRTYNDIFTNLYLMRTNPSIVHLTYFQKQLKIFKKKPLIVTVYDLIYEKHYLDYGLKGNNKYKINYLNEADHIICISEATRQDLLKYYDVDKDKTTVIHLGNDDFINTSKNSNNLKENIILYVGGRRRYKNFDILIDAFNMSKYLKNQFKVICVGGGNFTISELDKFKKLSLLENFVFCDADDNQLHQLYSKAKVFVTTSLTEGFGLPPLEAMRNYCPVLASDIKVYRETLGNFAEFFNPNDPEALKKKLESLTLENKMNLQFDAAYKHSKKFTWKKCAEETLSVYKKLV